MEKVIDIGKGTDKVTINIDKGNSVTNVWSVLSKITTPVMLCVREPDYCNDPAGWRFNACRGSALIDMLGRSIFIDGAAILGCPARSIYFDGRIIVEVQAADYREAVQNG